MPVIEYVPKNFADSSLAIIETADDICREYRAQGFDLTLRQLYYQFVSRDLIANTDRDYKRLGSIVNDARLAGMLDWSYIVDRTRNLRGNSHWDSPADIMRGAARGYAIEKWAEQPFHVEVWIEKDALVGVLDSCCPDLDVGFFSCRGYTSQSEVWSAAQRLGRKIDEGKEVVIVHLGDHDPSGIDMTRDIEHRLAQFIAIDRLGADPGEAIEDHLRTCEGYLTVDRIALNRDQIDAYHPPPNPAKLTDARAAGYIQQHGRSSWELDALEPTVLVDLIRYTVEHYRDETLWDDAVESERKQREDLTAASARWSDVVAFLHTDDESEVSDEE